MLDVAGWYDAGTLDTLLETNRTILETRGVARHPTAGADVVFVEPVYVEDGVTLRRATIGPNVSIGAGTTVDGSSLRDTIVGTGARIVGSTVHDSMIGDGAVVEGLSGRLTIGDHSEIRAE